MVRTFRALSALLSYPTAELVAAIPEIREVLRQEGVVGPDDLTALQRLLDALETQDLYEVQERYVGLFDRSRALSLHLFEHVHGESRDRGQAMVDLAALYRRHGFVVASRELPDFLPLFLEFLSLIELDEARRLLGDAAPILKVLAERLARRGAAYAAILEALVALASREDETTALAVVTEDPGTEDLAALDMEWEEAAVTFGPGDPPGDGCGRSRLMTRLRAAVRSPAAS